MRLFTRRDIAVLARKFTSRVDVVRLAVQPGQPGLEVRAHVPDGFFRGFQVRRGEHAMSVPGYGNQVSVQDEDTAHASAYIPVSGH